MKKLLYTLSLFFLFKGSIFSQAGEGFGLGGRFGLGESKITSNGLSSPQSRLAISGGIASTYRFNKWIALNADFLLSSVGGKNRSYTGEKDFLGNTTTYSYEEKFDLLNAEVPLTAQVSLWSGNFFVKGYGGPDINFRLLANQSREYDNADYNSRNGYAGRSMSQTNTVFYSMVYGIGIGAVSNDNRILFLDLRINNGIGPFAKINNANAFSNYYCISAGYTF
jgi:hypothetical protein